MRTVLAASIATGLFLLLLIGDMVLRAMIAGRMDAFFTSLATFSMDFAAIMLFGYILQRHILRLRPGTPYRALLAFIVLVIVSFCAGYVRMAVRDLVLGHVEQVVAERLVDPAMIPTCNALAKELIDVEVFKYAPGARVSAGWGERLVSNCDLMSEINGNKKRRELYIRLLMNNHMLKTGTTLKPEDLMLEREDLGFYFTAAVILALLSVGIFIWAVVEVVRGLREGQEPFAPTTSVLPAGGVR